LAQRLRDPDGLDRDALGGKRWSALIDEEAVHLEANRGV
jgi:hypothetical protein